MGKKEKPFFSVIISTFNRPKKLAKALRSLKVQKYTNWEVIISDDGSVQDNRNVVGRFSKTVPNNVVYIRHKHVGLAESRNLAARKAEGKFVTFLDDDDRYDRLHLIKRWELLKKNPRAKFLHGGVILKGDPCLPDRDDPKKLVHISKVVVGATFVVQKALFFKLGGFPKVAFGEDTDFFRKALAAKIPVIRSQSKTYYYHRSGASITSNILKKPRNSQNI